MKTPHLPSKGFTLIEILVVIAIISILSAILFPVFARTRENARKTSCLSNLKQLGMGVQMYSQDYDEKIPAAYLYWVTGNTNYLNSWMQLVMPYVKNAQVCECPSYSAASIYSENGPNKQIRIPHQSYTALFTVTTYTGRSLAEFTKPSETIYGLDNKACSSSAVRAAFPGAYCNGFYWGASAGEATAIMNRYVSEAPHLGGNNYFFIDGHAKWLNSVSSSQFIHNP